MLQSLRYNDFTFALEAERDLPWRPLRHGGPVFGENDRGQLGHYLEREYRLVAPKARLDSIIDATGQQRWHNPVREYLEGLKWDGKPRVEECLPGVTPTEYTRTVARKCLTAAVARIFDPGCKWDHTLILSGPENLGKTFWIDRLSRGYSANLGWLGAKDTLLTLHRSWIMISDEGSASRRPTATCSRSSSRVAWTCSARRTRARRSRTRGGA